MQLPDLHTCDLSPLPPLNPLSTGASSSDEVSLERCELSEVQLDEAPVEDLWRTADSLGTLKNESKLLTWEAFARPQYLNNEAPTPSYISEAGPAAFDAALDLLERSGKRRLQAGQVVRFDALLRSLWHLALGRESMLFPLKRYTTERGFQAAIEYARSSGCSVESTQDTISGVFCMGHAVQGLRAFIDSTYERGTSHQTLIAFASALHDVLDAVEEHVIGGIEKVRTLIQLEQLLELPKKLVLMMLELVEELKSYESDEEMFERLFVRVEENEETVGPFQDVLLRILEKVSCPSFEQIERLIGLREDISTPPEGSKEQHREEHEANGEEFEQRLRKLPVLLKKRDRETILEIQQSFIFIQRRGPDHPLSKARIAGVDLPSLKWEFDWSDIQRIKSKARTYETQVISAIEACRTHKRPRHISQQSLETTPIAHTFEPSTEGHLDLDEMIENSIKSLNKLPSSLHAKDLPSSLKTLILTQLTHHNTQPLTSTTIQPAIHIRPPLSLSLHLSLRPILQVRHELLSYTALNYILRSASASDSLQAHLNLHHAFSLFSSGLFATRLSSVLFSADIESAERQKGVVRTGGSGKEGMGLKVGTGERRRWPPASSEVRLALMGILGESWREEQVHRHSSLTSSPAPRGFQPPLPSNRPRTADMTSYISFSIRHIPHPDQITRILDPDSLFALDFLRLSHTPPTTLRPLFPPRVLDLYDRIFALWLRLLRVQQALKQAFRFTISRNQNSPTRQHADKLKLRLRWRANHILTTIISHFRDVGVSQPWTVLWKKVTALEHAFADPVPPPSASASERADAMGGLSGGPATLAALVKAHQGTLETIAGRLLLRKRRRKVAEALEKVCEDVLRFVGMLRREERGSEREDLDGWKEVEASFERNVKELVGLLGGLVDGVGAEKGDMAYFGDLVGRTGCDA